MKFTTTLENFNTRLWSYHIKVPYDIAQKFINGKDKRVMCSINGGKAIHCGLMPAGDDVYFINMNKEVRQQYGLEVGSQCEINLEKDTSEFGMPFPEEFLAVLEEDKDGKGWFDKLTPGKKRNLIYIVNKVKDGDKRIEKSIIIVEHLKMLSGKIDFKVLNASLRKRHGQ